LRYLLELQAQDFVFSYVTPQIRRYLWKAEHLVPLVKTLLLRVHYH
jgi:hypothetical protein